MRADIAPGSLMTQCKLCNYRPLQDVLTTADKIGCRKRYFGGPCPELLDLVYALMRIVAYGNKYMNSIMILGSLAEPTRLEALRLVWDGREHCVCELMRELGASQSRMSRHMATLKSVGLVTDRRDAQWVRYRRAPNLPQPVVALVDAALALPPDRERHAA